ncbi:reverse transcriptase domain-containing protein [Tanacetum coccineum]
MHGLLASKILILIGCLDTRKSTSGGIQFLGEKLVSWMSKKQDCTAMSTVKAEYVALSASCAQSAIAISCNPVQYSRTKYINVCYHFIKEQVERGIMELYFVRTEYQLADMFTKALLQERFEYLVRRLGMRCLTPAELEPILEYLSYLEDPFLRTGRALIDVYGEEITLRVDNEAVTFNLDQTTRYSSTNDKSANRIDIIDVVCEEYAPELLGFSNSSKPPELELKDLSSHLEYAYLEENDKLPVIIAKGLKNDEKDALLKVLKSHKRAIAWKITDIKGIDPHFCTHKILMEDDYKPTVQSQRRVNPKIHEVIKKEVLKLLDAGMIYPISDSPWVSPVHCVPKKGGITVVANEENELIPTRLVTGWRVCIDYRKLNEATRKDHFPLPFMDQMIERLAGNEFYCFLDGFSGYFQIPIDPQDQEKTTFTCPYGTFAYRRMPFGLCNAPGTFQRCMMAIFHDMIEKTMEVFMDDFSVFGDSFDSCLSNLEKMLKRCEDTNLVLNWEKCHFMCREGIVLGHKISKSGIEVDRAKVDVIAKLPHPTTVKGVRSFLGHAGFYRRFIQDFSKIARPMTHLLEKETPFVFSKDCIDAFQTLKKKLTEAPILVVPDWNLPFELMCDASDFAIAIEVPTYIEEGYYDPEGDVLYLESLLSDDTTHNLSPEVFFNHEPQHIENESDHDTFSPKRDPLHHEFAGSVITIPPRIDREHENYISRMSLLCGNSSSQSPENSHTIIESLPTSTTLIEDNDSNREEIDIFSGPDDSIPPGIESDFDSEEDIIDNLLNNDPIPEYERLTFDMEPNVLVINNVNEDECFDPGGGEINVEVDDSFTFVTRTFLPYLTYPEVSPLLSSTKNEDTIFDPGIST